jgi:hypothetical protein
MSVVEIESECTGRDRELKATGGQPRVPLPELVQTQVSVQKKDANLGHQAERLLPFHRGNVLRA